MRWLLFQTLAVCLLAARSGGARDDESSRRSVAQWPDYAAVLETGRFRARAYGLDHDSLEPLTALVDGDASNATTTADDQRTRRVLLVGGLDGDPASARALLRELRRFAADSRPRKTPVAISAVPAAHPAVRRVGGAPAVLWSFPPAGTPYRGHEAPAQYLWRWIGAEAPDLLVVVTAPRAETEHRWKVQSGGYAPVDRVGRLLNAAPLEVDGSLASAVVHVPPLGRESIPALLVTPSTKGPGFLETLLEACESTWPAGDFSPAREQSRQLLARSPAQVAEAVLTHYGTAIERVTYIPALALIGRLWAAEATGRAAEIRKVEELVAPFVSGEQRSLPENASGVFFAGHLVFAELARLRSHARYSELARAAADFGFDAAGRPREAMPSHAEMSDAVFMGCPILVRVGALTNERRYFEMALRHLRYLRSLTARADGLYRHSPLDEAAWGRGNGFPALGLAMSLTYWPQGQEGHAEVLAAYREHMAALARHQDSTGAWHQVIDEPASYRELTATSMITFAMLRGLRLGWLERETYAPVVDHGWRFVRGRIGDDGVLVDVCASTGKQPNLRAYLERPARVGRNGRGGAMALLVSLERARWEASLRSR